MSNANGHYLMTPDDRERLAKMLEGGIDTRDKRGFAIAVLSDLRLAESAGDEGAKRIVDAMSYDGVFRALDKQAKRETGVFKDAVTGQVLNVPKVGSIATFSDDGAATGERQLKLWQEMSRAEFAIWINHQRHLSESMRLKVRGLERVLKAWERFPDAANARDVCELAGIDPDELELAA